MPLGGLLVYLIDLLPHGYCRPVIQRDERSGGRPEDDGVPPEGDGVSSTPFNEPFVAPPAPAMSDRKLHVLLSITALALVFTVAALGVVLWSHASASRSSSVPQPLAGSQSAPQPDDSMPTSLVLEKTSVSIVRIVGSAPPCQRSLQGTGFVYASERVMTAAHVVAG